MTAPICLFVYNRPVHVAKVLEALAANKLASQSDLIVFSDGAKNPTHIESVNEVRAVVKKASGFKSVRLVEREKNFGLAGNIIGGVSEVLSSSDKVIVLEDDLITSTHFLEFMNEALRKYETVPQVGCIHGYTYPINPSMEHNFFLRGADCWGWGTWKRAWDLFEKDGSKLMAELKANGLIRDFDLNGSYSYSGMLQDQIDGKNNSWAVRWHASLFLKNKLTLYPKRSLVNNIGFDASGVHCAVGDQFDVNVSPTKIDVEDIPVAENREATARLEKFFRSQQKPKGWKSFIPEPIKVMRRKILQRLSHGS